MLYKRPTARLLSKRSRKGEESPAQHDALHAYIVILPFQIWFPSPA